MIYCLDQTCNKMLKFFFIFGIVTVVSTCEINEEIKIFQEYLRIPSVHPNVDYEPVVQFLNRQAEDLGLPVKVLYPGGPTKPVVIMTWEGQQPDLPSISLNSHMDVVTTEEKNWSHPPFNADIDDECRIIARGAQDMKCVGMQYLAAIRALKKSDIKLNRTIHVIFVPDEELGGYSGMAEFVKTSYFQDLNIGFGLDESFASESDTEIRVSYAEKTMWKVSFKITGQAGHGSLLLNNTVGQKLRVLLNELYEFRDAEEQRLQNPGITPGKVTSINLTKIKGGKQNNVIPSEIEAVFDVRVSVDADTDEVSNLFEKFTEKAGGGIKIEYLQKDIPGVATKVDSSNILWVTMKETVESMGFTLVPQIVAGTSDARFLRLLGIPVLGFSPLFNTPVLLHDKNEFIFVDVYLKGIEIYKKLIQNIGNM